MGPSPPLPLASSGGVLLRLSLGILFNLFFFFFLHAEYKFAVYDHCVKPRLPSHCVSDAKKCNFFLSLKALRGSTCTWYTTTHHDADVIENADIFPSCEQTEICKVFLSVISVSPGDFHVQGSGRESKRTYHTHVHTLYTAPDLLANSRGVMDTHEEVSASYNPKARRPGGKQDLLMLALPLLAPSAGCPWNDLHLITCGASVGTFLLPINFVIHLQQACSVHK